MTRILAALAVATAIATPAFAQSFDPEIGTGNVLQFSPMGAAQNAGKLAVRQNALNAYAAVPGGIGLYAPFSTGGGSIGYNEMLRNY